MLISTIRNNKLRLKTSITSVILAFFVLFSCYTKAQSITLSATSTTNEHMVVTIPANVSPFTLYCDTTLYYSTEPQSLTLAHYVIIKNNAQCTLSAPSTLNESEITYSTTLTPDVIEAAQVTSKIDAFIYQNQPIALSTIETLKTYTNNENAPLKPIYLAKLALYYERTHAHFPLLATLTKLINHLTPNTTLYAEALLLKGNALMAVERYNEASNIATQWLQLNTNTTLPTRNNVLGLTLLGFTELLAAEEQHDQNKLTSAYRILNNAQNLCETLNNVAPTNCLPEIYNGLATYYRIKKDIQSSADMLIQAIRYTEQSLLALPQDKQWKQKTLNLYLSDYTNNLAIILDWMGNIAESQHLLRRSLFYNVELAEGPRKAISYRNLAKSYQVLGRYDLAERYYLKSFSMSESMQSEFGITDIHLTLLTLEMAQAKYTAAQHRLSLHGNTITQNLSGKSNQLLAIQAELSASTNDWENAITFYKLAYSLYEQHPKFQSPNASLSLLKAGMKISSSTENITIKHEFSALNNALILSLENTNLGSLSNTLALKRLKNKILINRITDKTKNTHTVDHTQIQTIFENTESIVNQLFITLDTINNHENEFNWASYTATLINDISPLIVHTKNNNLLLKLWQLTEKVDAAVLKKQRQLSITKQRLEANLLGSKTNEHITQKSVSILAKHTPNNQQHLHQRDVLKDKQLAHTQHEILPTIKRDELSIKYIMQTIAPNTALLKYLHIENQYFVFWVTTKNWGFLPLTFTEKVTTPSSPIPHKNTPRLTSLIPNAILQNTAISHLLIKPSGSLYNIAFASIKNENEEHLTDRYSVTRIPSASMYFSDKNTPKTPTKYTTDISLFIDPTFDNVAPATTSNITAKKWLNSFSPLPWTRQSENNIKAIFNHSRITIFAGDKATKEALLSEQVRHSKLLHIATHAYYHPSYPDLTGLVTTSTNASLGYASLDELLARPFSSDLVVLSACETQMGAYYESEGTRGLAYSFLAQGAASVIGTLWKVPDKPTALFMQYFYQALKHYNGNKAEALQQARNKMKRSGRYKSPIYWASFVLTNTHQSTEVIKL